MCTTGIRWRRCCGRFDSSRIVIDGIRVRDRARFKYDTDNQLRLINHQHPQGLLLPDQKFWQFSVGANHSDNPYGLGLAHSLYWPVFFKRNDIKFWLIFLEKFGMPTTAGKLPGGKIDSPTERTRALQALQAIQTDSAVVIPDDMTIELIEAARGGTADYSELYERMDKAISKVVLSQTMTTDDGSSRSQAEVHKGVANWVVKSDAICCARVLTAARWPGWSNGISRVPRRLGSGATTEPPEDLLVRAERDEKIISLGYEPTEAYMEETYGPGWVKKVAPESPPADQPAPMGPDFTEISELARARVGNRADAQQLVDAAEYLGTRYRDLYGKRVDQILAYLEETDDVDTFKRQLTAMMADLPGARDSGEPAQCHVVCAPDGSVSRPALSRP